MNKMKVCLRCGNKFTRVDNLKRHLSGKTQCPIRFLDVTCKEIMCNYDILIDSFIEMGMDTDDIFNISRTPAKIVKKKYQCSECYMTFQFQSGYSRHCNHRCKGRVITDLKNYNMNDFGQENTDYITDAIILTFLKKPEDAIESISRYIHFNNLHPENTNIKLLGFSNSFVRIYSQCSWNYYIRDKVINKMIESALFIMDDVFSRRKEMLYASDRKKYDKFLKDLEISRCLKKNIKVQLRLLILNKKIISI